MKDVECPYCGKWQKINHDDGVGYEEDILFFQECRDCYKTFTYTALCVWSYDAQKADCLNEGEHCWKPTHTFPKEYTKMRCTMCDKERPLRKEEIEKYNIPSISHN